MATKEEHSLTAEALEKIGRDVNYSVSSAERRAMLSVLEEQGQIALKTVIDGHSAFVNKSGSLSSFSTTS